MPVDFIQVNGPVNADLVACAIDWLGMNTGDRVLDLFCGIGNFTLPLARRGATVLGLEGADDLVRRGRDNAQRNGVERSVAFETADLYAQPLDAIVEAAFERRSQGAARSAENRCGRGAVAAGRRRRSSVSPMCRVIR